MVENSFQKYGGTRDYQWSPGYGLFDMVQILKTIDHINNEYNDISTVITEILNYLNSVRSKNLISFTSFQCNIMLL